MAWNAESAGPLGVLQEWLDHLRYFITNFRIPSLDEMMAEASEYQDKIQVGILDATDPNYQYWEHMMHTPALILLFLGFFWLACWASASRKEGGVRSTDSLYGVFLTYQLFGFGINIATFFSPFLIWHAQGKCIRVLALSLEAVQRGQGMAWMVRLYVATQLFYFLYSLLYLVRKEQNPRGRTLKLFHEGLKPIKAWVSLRYNPGGGLTTFMLLDLMFSYLCNVYYVVERVYRNLYSKALDRLARFVCLMECLMHLLTLARLSSVANSQDLKYSAPEISWIILYCSFSAISLGVVLAGMFYSAQLHQETRGATCPLKKCQ